MNIKEAILTEKNFKHWLVGMLSQEFEMDFDSTLKNYTFLKECADEIIKSGKKHGTLKFKE